MPYIALQYIEGSWLTSVFDWLNDWRNGWPRNWLIELATQRMRGWMTNVSGIRLGERSLLFSSLGYFFREPTLFWAAFALGYFSDSELSLVWGLSSPSDSTSFVIPFFCALPLLWSTYSLQFFPQLHLPSGATSVLCHLFSELLYFFNPFFPRALWPEPSELLLFQANFEHLWATLSQATLKVSYSEPLGAALRPCLATTSCIPARCAIPIKTIHGSVPIVLPTPAQSHIRVARARKQIPAFSQHKSLVLNCGASLGPSRFFENCALATVLCPHLPKVVRPNYQMVDDVMWFVHYCKIL